jgi:hypothetical protein
MQLLVSLLQHRLGILKLTRAVQDAVFEQVVGGAKLGLGSVEPAADLAGKDPADRGRDDGGDQDRRGRRQGH